MTEEWEEIQDFEGYFVSSYGSVQCRCLGQGKKFGRLLKPNKSSRGYRQVRIRKNGKEHSLALHVLVCKAFLGDRPEGLQIRHLDGDKENNKISNLVYGTAKENGEDNARLGVMPKGENHLRAKIDHATAEKCISFIHSGMKKSKIAKELGISKHIVYHISSGVSWKHLQANNRGQDKAAK